MKNKNTLPDRSFPGIMISLFMIFAMLLITNCGDDGNDKTSLVIKWQFSTGNCASNGIEKISVEATPSSGDTLTGEAYCCENSVDLGTVSAGSYSIQAQGLDSTGKVVAENYATTTSIPEGGISPPPVDVTLYPKSSNVNVTWNGCPSGVILPYYITLYNPPAQTGDTPTEDVKSVQESCSSGSATITNVAPGDYVIELDSKAVTPKVYGTKSITVVAGEDLDVSFDLP